MIPTLQFGGAGRPIKQPAGGGGGGIGAHDYWRINVSAANTTDFLAIQEIELQIAGVDQTSDPTGTSGRVLASSSFGTAPPENAFDNDTTTNTEAWVTDSGAGAVGWIWYRFGYSPGGPGPLAIDAVKIWPQVGLAARAPKDFTIETSPDGTNWTVRKTVTGETGWVSGTPRTYTLP